MFFHGLIFPLYNKLIRCIAYGPWGPIHQISILIFRWIYKIPNPEQRFSKLGEFFLRSTPIELAESPLVSPAESLVIEGPASFSNESVTVKGLKYRWVDMPELKNFNTEKAIFWNLYLAPHNYHWVHSPAGGTKPETFAYPGRFWPVNAWGRRKSPALYAENKRFTFKFFTEEFGWVLVICVGALGVSSFRIENIKQTIQKGQRLLGFEMGSSVLLVVEKKPDGFNFRMLPPMLKVGDGL